MITLESIWNSSTGLLDRFGLKPTLEASWDKVIEETYEAVEALQELRSRPQNIIFKSDAMCEICDVIITLFNASYSSNVSFDCFPTNPTLGDLWGKAQAQTIGEVIDKTVLTPRKTMVAFQKQLFVIHMTIIGIDDSTHGRLGVYPGAYGLLAIRIEHAIKCLLRVAAVHKLTIDDFERSMESTMHKNGAKSHETHEIRNGQIKRRQPAPTVETVEGQS